MTSVREQCSALDDLLLEMPSHPRYTALARTKLEEVRCTRTRGSCSSTRKSSGRVTDRDETFLTCPNCRSLAFHGRVRAGQVRIACSTCDATVLTAEARPTKAVAVRHPGRVTP